MDSLDISRNATFTSGLLTATGAETVHDTTATINYSLGGVLLQKTAITDGATPTTDAVSGSAITLTANHARLVVWCLDSSGDVKCIAGDTVAWDGTAFQVAPHQPQIPDAYVPFATQLIKAGSTTVGTWTFGSSNWNATGVTNTIKNVSFLPGRPRTA